LGWVCLKNYGAVWRVTFKEQKVGNFWRAPKIVVLSQNAVSGPQSYLLGFLLFFSQRSVNLRHLQHHTAQLADHLRQHAGIGIDWIGK
jgi:hypothetical protein